MKDMGTTTSAFPSDLTTGDQSAEYAALLRALMLVDADVRHHNRDDSERAALIRPQVIAAVRAAIAKASGGQS